MKITILSEIDYAGSGFKMYEAIKRHTDIDIEYYSGKYYNPYGHQENTIQSRKQVQNRINESDIVHLKGDFPPKDGYMNFKILHKPIIVTVSGSHFRKKEYGGYGKFMSYLYSKARIKTAFTPDLCYPDYSSIWTPHPIDCENVQREWKWRDPPLLMHMPSNNNKGTDFIKSVFAKLKKKCEVQIIKGLSFKEAVEKRKEATIFFDQFKVGFYGNSAIEAMQYGIPTAAWISPFVKMKKERICPVITEARIESKWVKLIESTLYEEILMVNSIEAKYWCDKIHSYRAVAEQWEDLYYKCLNHKTYFTEAE